MHCGISAALHVARAGLIAFFVAKILECLCFLIRIAGLVDRDVVWLTLALRRQAVFGGYVGSKLFERFGGEKFKPVTIGSLSHCIL